MGTTLEVLAPYLPYGIQVKYGGSGTHYLLNGLNYDGKQTWFAATKSFNGWLEFGLRDILPILRPFEALVQPLEDGTVPLYEYVRFMWPKQTTMRHRAYGDIIEVHGTTALYMATRADFEAGNMHRRGTDYLRRHHFAVGLQPHQYIAK